MQFVGRSRLFLGEINHVVTHKGIGGLLLHQSSFSVELGAEVESEQFPLPQPLPPQAPGATSVFLLFILVFLSIVA